MSPSREVQTPKLGSGESGALWLSSLTLKSRACGPQDPNPTPSSNCCPPTLARPEKSLQKNRNKETQAQGNGHSSVRQSTGNRIKGRCVPEGWGDLLLGAPPTPTIAHRQIQNSHLWKLFSVSSTCLFLIWLIFMASALCVRSRGH